MLIKKPSKILLVSSVCFLRAYSGTLHLARALRAFGHTVQILVTATEAEAAEYATLDIPVTCLVRRKGPGFSRKWETLRHRLRIFFEILQSRQIIVTENGYLLEASIAKKIRRGHLILGQYCQELHLAEDYPDIPRIRLLSRLARVPDFVVDVEPNRARVRQQKLRLRESPYILHNTLSLHGMPPRAEAGALETLAGVPLPLNFPILIHMGGIGREKPLERIIDAVSKCRVKVFFLAFCNGPPQSIEILRQYADSKLEPGTFAVLGPRRRDELLASAWEADIGVIDYSPSVENSYNQRFCAPTKLYEFMALGLAILGSDNDSLSQIVDGERIGSCAQGGRTHDLALSLESIVANRDEMQAMGSRAAVAFQRFHCYEKLCLPVVEQISNLFERPTQPIL